MSFKQIFSVAFYLPIVAGNAIAFFLGQPQITSKIFCLNSQRFMKCFLNDNGKSDMETALLDMFAKLSIMGKIELLGIAKNFVDNKK